MKKHTLKYALEGTHGGDVVSGLLSWTGENLRALFFREKVMVNEGFKKELTRDFVKCVKALGHDAEANLKKNGLPAFVLAEHAEDYVEMVKMYSRLYDVMVEDKDRFIWAIDFLSCFTPSKFLPYEAEYRREKLKVIHGGRNSQ